MLCGPQEASARSPLGQPSSSRLSALEFPNSVFSQLKAVRLPAHGGSPGPATGPGLLLAGLFSPPQRPAARVIGPALKAAAFRIPGLQDESVYSSPSPFQVSGCQIVTTSDCSLLNSHRQSVLPWHSGEGALQFPVAKHRSSLAPTRSKPSSQVKRQVDWYLKAPRGWEQLTWALFGAVRPWHGNARG